MDATGATEADIDLYFGWMERFYNQKMQVHYESRFTRTRRTAVTSLPSVRRGTDARLSFMCWVWVFCVLLGCTTLVWMSFRVRVRLGCRLLVFPYSDLIY